MLPTKGEEKIPSLLNGEYLSSSVAYHSCAQVRRDHLTWVEGGIVGACHKFTGKWKTEVL